MKHLFLFFLCFITIGAMTVSLDADAAAATPVVTPAADETVNDAGYREVIERAISNGNCETLEKSNDQYECNVLKNLVTNKNCQSQRDPNKLLSCLVFSNAMAHENTHLPEQVQSQFIGTDTFYIGLIIKSLIDGKNCSDLVNIFRSFQILSFRPHNDMAIADCNALKISPEIMETLERLAQDISPVSASAIESTVSEMNCNFNPGGVVDRFGQMDHIRSLLSEDRDDGMVENFSSEMYVPLSSLASILYSKYPPDQHYFVGIGRSFSPLVALIQAQGNGAMNLPISFLTDYSVRNRNEDVLSVLFSHFDNFIDLNAIGNKTVVVFDYLETGASLEEAAFLLRRYLELHGKNLCSFGLANAGFSSKSASYHGEMIVLDAQLSDQLHYRSMKPFSEYGKYHPAAHSPSSKQVKSARNPKYYRLRECFAKKFSEEARNMPVAVAAAAAATL
ncbi:MAG: hypothetical protein HQK53_11995 [Oligoflexia bacterium]|nr:hypothetical protein [Oligoflexia bacterium]